MFSLKHCCPGELETTQGEALSEGTVEFAAPIESAPEDMPPSSEGGADVQAGEAELEEQGSDEDEDDDDDDVVIVVDSDDEDLPEDEQSQDDDEVDDEGDVDAEDYEDEEFAEEYPVEGEIDYGDDDDDDGDDIDESMDDDDDPAADEDAVSMEEQPEGAESVGDRRDDGPDQVMEDDDDVVEISEDEETEGPENEMEVGSSEQQEQVQPMEEHQPHRVMPELRVEPPGEQPATTQGQETQIERVPFQHGTVPRQRLASLGRAPMFLGAGAPFEDFGDDRQVPSTPTLFVPRRTDGFAEAINSPLLQGRFHFGGSDGEPSRSMAPALAQLATQGDLGLDDTRINLLGGDEDGGRSVPTTPLQTHAPATVLTASPSSQTQESPSPVSQDTSRSVPATTTEASQQSQPDPQSQADQDEPDTLPSEVPQSSPATPDVGTEDQAPTAVESQGQGEEASVAVPTSEGAESMDRAEQATSSEAGQGERPKPKRIVWQDSPGPSQLQQRPQPGRGGMAFRSRGRFIQRSFPRGSGGPGARGRGNRFARGQGQPRF